MFSSLFLFLNLFVASAGEFLAFVTMFVVLIAWQLHNLQFLLFALQGNACKVFLTSQVCFHEVHPYAYAEY